MAKGPLDPPLGDSPLAKRRNLALLRAAYAADRAAVVAALEAGADIDANDPYTGLCALHIAAGTNNLPLAQLLVESWSASFFADKRGRWPSVVAAECRASDELAVYIAAEEAAFLEGNDRGSEADPAETKRTVSDQSGPLGEEN